MQLFVFLWKYVWKLLGFSYMHENKIIFFLKKEINFKKFWDFFFEFSKKKLETFRRKQSILILDIYLTV
jgi:hypothetical protein